MLEIDIKGNIDGLAFQSGPLRVRLHDHENIDVGVRLRIATGDRSEQSKIDEVWSETSADPSDKIGDGPLPTSVERRHDTDRLHGAAAICAIPVSSAGSTLIATVRSSRV